MISIHIGQDDRGAHPGIREGGVGVALLLHLQHLHELSKQGRGVQLRLQLPLLHHGVPNAVHCDSSRPVADSEAYNPTYLLAQGRGGVPAVLPQLRHAQHALADRASRDEHPHVRRHQAVHAPGQPDPVRGGAEAPLPLPPPHLQCRPHHPGRHGRHPGGPLIRWSRLHYGHTLSVCAGEDIYKY